MELPELSVEEEKEAIEWRIKKCGWDSFEAVKKEFKEKIKRIDNEQSKKGKSNR